MFYIGMLNDRCRFGGWYFLVCLSLFFNKNLVFCKIIYLYINKITELIFFVDFP